jgi:hypothetical protein
MEQKLNQLLPSGSTSFPWIFQNRARIDASGLNSNPEKDRFDVSEQKKEPLGVLPPRVHTGVGARHALFPIDWLFGAWTNLSTHPAFCFGCQFPDAIHHPRFTAGEKFRPHSRAATTIPDRSLLSEASLPGSVLTCR